MLVVAVILGAVLGSALGQVFGAVVGALLAWLLVRSTAQSRQIAALTRSIEALREPRAEALPVSAATPAGISEAAATLDPQASLPVRAEGTDHATAASPQRSSPAPGRGPAPLAVAIDAIKGWLLGGNAIVKAGVGILFVGLAFLAKYASEHVDAPVELRLAGIAAVALVLLGLGWRLRLQRPGYAQVLQGGAVAVLYLTLFVAFRFYGVLPVGPVFALMVLVATLAAALAVLQDARALAIVGALGGFATPLLVSSGSGNQVALFTYYLVLDLGIAMVAWHRTWRALNLIGFFATFLVGTVWGVMRYQPQHYLSSQGFLLAYFLLFNAILLLPARRQPDADAGRPHGVDSWVDGTLLFGVPTIVFVLQHGLVRHVEYGTAISALVLAGFYVLAATAMRSRPRLNVTFEASLAIAIVFLTLVIPFALDARSTAGAWALEGAGLVWLGFRQSRSLARAFGYLLLLLSGAVMLAAHDRLGAPTVAFNATLFNALMAAAAALAAAFFVRGLSVTPNAAPGRWGRIERHAEPWLIAWGTLWALVAAGVQIDAFVTAPFVLAAWLTAISLIASVCTILATRLAWPRVAFPALLHAPVLGLGVLACAAAGTSPTSGGGAWAWPVALATHLFVLWRAAPHWARIEQHVVHGLGVLVLAALGALQGRAITAHWGDTHSAWAWLGWLVVPTLVLLVLVRPATASRWPVRAASTAYGAAAAVLTLGLLLWTLLANVASSGTALPLPYVPLLNPLDVGIAVALTGAWLWLRGDAARAILPDGARLGPAVLGLSGFVWLNAMLIRGFHHFDGVPFRVDAWLHSLAVQTGITLLWTVTALALMWWSARRALRLPWMVGAGLLAAVVLKLLLVDLSGSGTVTRIVSFIGVGVLMLVIGYVAPLPGRDPRHAAT